jgi:hypothetical protein
LHLRTGTFQACGRMLPVLMNDYRLCAYSRSALFRAWKDGVRHAANPLIVGEDLI